MTDPQGVSRREFIGTMVAGLAAGSSLMAATQQSRPGGIPTRILGRTGERVSIIGVGGYTIGQADKNEAVSMMRYAIDRGVTFFDNCWNYNGDWSETVMGNALAENGYRDKVFLQTKCCGRDENFATEQLEGSLRRLKTDRIDLWLFHGISRETDAPRIFGEKGAIQAALKARKAGKIRYIGFSGHRSPDLHLQMLAQDFHWDAVQMPVNVLDAHYKSFQKRVLPVLNERDVGCIGMKALGAGRFPKGFKMDATLYRRYSLSLPIATLLCGMQNWDDVKQDVGLATDFKPLDEEEIEPLLADAVEHAKNGVYEPYKIDKAGCEWQHRKDQELAARA